jgi:hypothetical protein
MKGPNATIVALVSVLWGCSGDGGPTGPQLSDLAGTWEATRYEITELVGDGTIEARDVEYSMEIDEDGSFTTLTRAPDAPEQRGYGQLSLADGTITLVEGGEPLDGTIELIGLDILVARFNDIEFCILSCTRFSFLIEWRRL